MPAFQRCALPVIGGIIDDRQTGGGVFCLQADQIVFISIAGKPTCGNLYGGIVADNQQPSAPCRNSPTSPRNSSAQAS